MTLVSPTLRDEITANMRAAKARMWVRIKGGNRELTHYIAEVVLPVLTIGAYVILYKTLGLPSSLGAAVIIGGAMITARSEEHTSELQSRLHLVCRLLLEKKKKK